MIPQTLTALNLSCNRIGNPAVKYFSEALQSNTVLTILILGCQYNKNGIGDIGMQYLSDALTKNKVEVFLEGSTYFYVVYFS